MERTEYRVVGNRRGRRGVTLACPDDAGEARALLETYRNGGVYSKLRIQARTITETPWVDLDEQAAEVDRG
jgi:hypothetical protein